MKYIYNLQTEEEKKELTILERCNYEVQAKMSIVKIAMEQKINLTNPDVYQNCIEKYIDSFTNFELQKKIFENKIIKPKVKENCHFTWYASFVNESIEIIYE